MIVTSLTLHNFGLYAGDHSIDLSMASAQRPVILIGGMNGRGKTTLLEAVLLALYGRQSFAFTTSRMPYGAYLKKYISTGENCHDAYVELKLQLHEAQPALTLRRSWSDGESPLTDHLAVYRGETYDPYLSEHWSTFMETVLPAGVSKLFFFDGEKITELANDQTDEGLKFSIKSLLGIDTIDRLIADLNRIIARQEISRAKGGEHAELDQHLEIVASKHGEREDLLQQMHRVEARIQELDKEEKRCRRELDGLGGNLVEKKQFYKDRKDELKKELDGVTGEARKRAGGALPLTMVTPLLRSLKIRVRREQEDQQRQTLLQEVQTLQASINRVIEEQGYPAEIARAIAQCFEPFQEKQSQAPGLGVPTSDHVVDQIGMLLGGLPDGLTEARRLTDRKRELEDQIQSLAQNIDRAEGEMEAQQLYDRYRVCVEERTKCQGLRQDLESALAELDGAIRAEEKTVRLLKQSIVEGEQGRMREARLIRYANAGIQVMETFREKLQRAKVAQLEERINERFQVLSEKKNLVERVEIDPVTLSISLRGCHSEDFSLTKLSAGERQMLVIALLWGLASCLENPLPVIIDTPLARLDSRHRENFVKKYLPQAGQQVIVLSTDEEISGAYAQLLSPYIAKEYLLEYDAQRNQTRVKNSYFGR